MEAKDLVGPATRKTLLISEKYTLGRAAHLRNRLTRIEWDTLVQAAYAQFVRDVVAFGPDLNLNWAAERVSDYLLRMGYAVSEVVDGLFTSAVNGVGVRVRVVSKNSTDGGKPFETLPDHPAEPAICGSLKLVMPVEPGTDCTRSSIWLDP